MYLKLIVVVLGLLGFAGCVRETTRTETETTRTRVLWFGGDSDKDDSAPKK